MDLDRDGAPVLSPVFRLENRVPFFEDFPADHVEVPAVSSLNEVKRCHRKELLPAVPEHHAGHCVYLDKTARETVFAEFVDMDGIVCRLENFPELCLALFQCRLFLQPLPDLAECPVPHLAVRTDLLDEFGHVVDEYQCIGFIPLRNGMDCRPLETEPSSRQGCRDEMGVELCREESSSTALEDLANAESVLPVRKVGVEVAEITAEYFLPGNSCPFLNRPVPADDRVIGFQNDDAGGQDVKVLAPGEEGAHRHEWLPITSVIFSRRVSRAPISNIIRMLPTTRRSSSMNCDTARMTQS
ncbi:MAG: hypothetical protein A4E39_01109 [Methanoregulaceae archaeon PtaB.Bin152]|nr:MAG: hypothetical protein A4E39_01109 [Methanoregulaceae archaeon PtaB.Bin152]